MDIEIPGTDVTSIVVHAVDRESLLWLFALLLILCWLCPLGKWVARKLIGS